MNKLAKAIEKGIAKGKIEDVKKVASILWNAIKEKAEQDPFYKADLLNWLDGEGSTVFLRDVICAPFEKMDYGIEMHNPHGNAWVHLDTLAHKLRVRAKFVFPEIELGNGLKITFSHFCNFANPVYFGETSKGRIRFTILDDEVYTMTPDEEPNCPIKKEYQPSLFEKYTYDFFKGNFVEKVA